MTCKICILVLFFSSLALAESKFTVLERNTKNNGIFYKEVELLDLTSQDSFEGKYFKIVKSKSNQAIRFTEDKNLVFKAATVYYHLSKAREFWLTNIKADSIQGMEPITVRLEITNLFDEQGHFANDQRNPQFNNAVTIPEGETPSWVPAHKQDKWGKEIWFRPMRKILTSELPSLGPNPLYVALQTLEGPYRNFESGKLTFSILARLFYPRSNFRPIWKDFVRFAGTSMMTNVVLEGAKKMDPLFLEKWYYLDTAMVPEVIYHEYAHVVLSDYLELSHSTPVIEGMADYFAAIMANKRKVYDKVPGFSNSAPKDTQNKTFYTHWYEMNNSATSDFVLSILWDVKETFKTSKADQIVFESRRNLSTKTSSINQHLLKALLDACTAKCDSPRNNKLDLYQAFSRRGF